MKVGKEAKIMGTYNLFGGLSSTGGYSGFAGLYGLVSDYSSIRNGSYKRLLKAYYANDDTDSAKSKTATETKKKTLDDWKVKSATKKDTVLDGIKSSVNTLATDVKAIAKSSEEVTEKTVNTFVSDYNKLVDSVGKTSNVYVQNKLADMTKYVAKQKDELAKVGITIGADNKLSVDKEKFAAAPAETLSKLFKGSASFASMVGMKAENISTEATLQALKSTSMYNANGTYQTVNTSSNLNDLL